MGYGRKGEFLFKSESAATLKSSIDLTSFLAGLAGAILIYFPLLERSISMPMQHFSDRAIGVTVLTGLDANLRTLWYCLHMFGVTILFLGIGWFNRALFRRYSARMPYLMITTELTMQRYLLLVSLFMVLYGLFKDHPFSRKVAAVFFVAGLSMIAVIAIKEFYFRRRPAAISYMRDQSLTLFSVFFSIALIFTGWVVLGITIEVNLLTIVFLFLSSGFLYLFLPFILSFLPTTTEKTRTAFAYSCVIFASLPALLPLSNEAWYTIRLLQFTGPENLARGIAGLAIFSGVLVFILMLFRGRPSSTLKIARNLIFPIFLGGIFLCTEFPGVISFASFDLFHNGERMLITQQLLQHGQVPFIDILPTHGIMDFFGQLLYSLINGYRGIEQFLWRSIPVLAGVILWYFLLSRLISPFLALLIILVSPEAFLFNDYYRMILVVGFILLWVIRNPGIRQYLVLWLGVAVLFFWRFDFGIITLLATAGIIPAVVLLPYRGSLFSAGKYIRDLFPPLLAGVAVFIAVILVYWIILKSAGTDPSEWFRQIYYYFKIQAPTQSIPAVYNRPSVLFLIEYIVSPFISIIYLVIFIHQLFFGERRTGSLQFLLVWIAVFSLIMTMRTVQRHGLLEAFNPILGMFLIAALPWMFHWKNRIIPVILFFSAFLVHTMLLAEIPRRGYVKNYVHAILPDSTLYSFFEIPDKGSRVKITDSSQFQNIKRFTDTYMSPEQTFFDFSNAPLLYVFTNRLFPAHLIPNLYHAAEPIQEEVIRRLEGFRSEGRLPFIIFRQGTLWDIVDSVPQPVRSYRVAEYLYKNYKPFVLSDNYEIWKENGDSTKIGRHRKERLNFIAGDKFPGADLEVVRQASDTLFVSTRGVKGSISGFAQWPEVHYDTGMQYILKIEISSNKTGAVRIYFKTDGRSEINKKYQEIKIRQVNQFQKYYVGITGISSGARISDLLMVFPGGARIAMTTPEFTQGDFIPLEETSPQHFNLMQLPYVWGNFDPKNSVNTTPVLATVASDAVNISAGEVKRFNFPAAIDKSMGNYLHIVAKTSKPAVLTVSLADAMNASVSFNLKPTGIPEHYMVRISTLYAWMTQPVHSVMVKSTGNITISAMDLRRGD